MDSAGIFGAEVMLLNLTHAQQEAGLAPVIGAIQTQTCAAEKKDALTNYANRLGLTDLLERATRSAK